MAFFRRRDVKRVLSTKQRNGKQMVSHRWYDFCLPFVFFLSRDLNLEASQILFWWAWACSARLVFFEVSWCSTLSRFNFKWILISVNYRRTQLDPKTKYVTGSKGDQTPIVLYWSTFVPFRFNLGNCCHLFMGMLPATPRTLNVARLFVNFVALKFRSRSRGGTRRFRTNARKEESVLYAVSTCTNARFFFVNAILSSQSAKTLHQLFVNHHEIVAWFSFLKGSDLETPWRTGFQHGIWQFCFALLQFRQHTCLSFAGLGLFESICW